jgi:hypothetical protein
MSTPIESWSTRLHTPGGSNYPAPISVFGGGSGTHSKEMFVDVAGNVWPNDGTAVEIFGNPSTTGDGNALKMTLNTGANHDYNITWTHAPREGRQDVFMRSVRGLAFQTKCHGSVAKHQISLRGVGMILWNAVSDQYVTVPLQWRSAIYGSHLLEPIRHENTESWVSHRFLMSGDTFAPYLHPNWRWYGVVFHLESTFATGSSIGGVYVQKLVPIVDPTNSVSNDVFPDNRVLWYTP